MSLSFELPKTPAGCYLDFSKPMFIKLKNCDYYVDVSNTNIHGICGPYKLNDKKEFELCRDKIDFDIIPKVNTGHKRNNRRRKRKN